MHAMTRRWIDIGLLLAALLLLLAAPSLPAAAQEGAPPGQIHVVQQGETAVGIAARYGVSLASLLEANGLRGPWIAPGTRLVIPAPASQALIHLVRPRETLASLAAQYGVSVAEIMQANGMTRPGGLFVGQRLLIPQPAAPQSGPTPTPCGAGCAPIVITAPQRNSVISSPVQVAGQGAGYEQKLLMRVLDAAGYEIGQGVASIEGTPGAVGPFSGVITFTLPAATQPGRIQVYSQSPADGAIEQLTSLPVTLQGTGLDAAIERLKAGLETRDYRALTALMSEHWQLSFYSSEAMTLSQAQALQQLRANYLGPGQVLVDLAVDARRLLESLDSLPAGVTHVVFSTGWGSERRDDAFLLFSVDARGQTRWSGMVYVFDALRPY